MIYDIIQDKIHLYNIIKGFLPKEGLSWFRSPENLVFVILN